MRIRYRESLTAPGEPREGLFDIAEDLPSGWVCTYRLANQDGQSVIAELSIHPSGKDVPQGGLTTRILRRVRLGAHLAAITATVRGWASGGTPRKDRTTHIPAAPGRSAQVRVVFGAEDLDRDTAEGLGFSGPPRERRPGRPGRSDREFAELAEQYVDARGRGSTRPTADVARERGYDVAHIRDGIHEARERGLLTRPATKGRAGGELTPRARELLEQE
jgi:hypothetical protein